MTEYEIADLALSTQEGIREQISLVQTQIGLGQAQLSLVLTGITMFYTLLFGYLIVAYFIGANLTRGQTIMLTLLYSFTVLVNRISGWNAMGRVRELRLDLFQLSPDTPKIALDSDGTITALTVGIVALYVASLYFMWDVRHPKDV
jgi:hypothetical protein